MTVQPISTDEFKSSCERYAESSESAIRYFEPVDSGVLCQDVVPSSELALHCGYADHRVQMVAVFEREVPQGDGKIWTSRYAYALLDNGTFAHGLISEIVPWSIRQQHNLG